jgi:hypothetical protein
MKVEQLKVIVYSDETLELKEGELLTFDILEPSYEEYNEVGGARIRVPHSTTRAEVILNIGEPIELDPTTMLKIAKHNKSVEIQKLEKDIFFLKEDKAILEHDIKLMRDKLKEVPEFILKYLYNNEVKTIEQFVNEHSFDEDCDCDYCQFPDELDF